MNSQADKFLEEAVALLEAENEDLAIELLDKVIELEPGCGEAFLRRAEAKRIRCRIREALDDYSTVLKLNAVSFQSLLGRAICLLKLFEFEQAFEAIEAAYRIDSTAEVYYWRGRILYELRRYDESLADFERAIELAKVFPEALAFRRLLVDVIERERLKANPPENTYDLFSPSNEIDFEHYGDAHPKAKELLDLPFFWSFDEFSPIGGDTGCDVMAELWQWRLYNPKASMKTFMADLFDRWGYDNGAIEELAGGAIEQALSDMHHIANGYDDVVIAIAFGQFMVDGHLDKHLGKLAQNAIKRQFDPRVMEHRAQSDKDYVESRRKISDALNKMPTK